HFLSDDPPQSTSVSSRFWIPSSWVGAAHVPPLQTPLSQSAPSAHPLPSAHLFPDDPPQSTSVSSPSFVPLIPPELPPDEPPLEEPPTSGPLEQDAMSARP